MPKNRKVVKKDGVVHKYNVSAKLRIGTRKSGKSAYFMSNAELMKIMENNEQRRYHNKARAVLRSRGVALAA